MGEIPEDIIKGCARKDAGCQKIIYETYYKKMYAICRRYAGDHDEAKDLLHDGFIKLFDRIASFREYPRLEAWTRRLFVNLCIDYMRSSYKKNIRYDMENREEPAAEVYEERETDTHFDMHRYTVDELVEAIGKLKPDHRLIINMYAIEKYSHQEIADKLGITHSTSRSKLLRARLSLRKILTDNTSLGQ